MNITEKMKTEDFDFLFNAILKLETLEECHSFFEDLCTMQELISISQRLRVAKLLTEKKIYNDIVRDTGASTATISRVNRTLNYGHGGYSIAFDRMEDDLQTEVTLESKPETKQEPVTTVESPATDEKQV